MSDFFSYGDTPAPAPAAPRAILGDLSSEDWEKFIGYAARRRYPAGALVVASGDGERLLGFVASGRLELRGAGAPQRRGEGEVFGILSFLDGAASEVEVRVTPDAPAELLLLTPQTVAQLAAWQPRIAMALLRDLGGHVAARLRRLQPGD